MDMLEQWSAWLATDAPRRLSPTTIRDYQRQLERFVTWLATTLGQSAAPEQMTLYRMERYLSELEGQVRRHQRKPASYNKAVAALLSFGAWLVASEQTRENPARRLRTVPEPPGPVRSLERTTIVRMLDAAHHTGDLRDALVVEILAHTGLRAHEVAAIQLADLEQGQRTTWIRVQGKGGKVRRVPVPKAVGSLIQEYLVQRASKEMRRPMNGPLLVGQRGEVTRTTINRIVDKVARRAQLSQGERERITPHAFRHTVATRVVRQRDLVTAADLLGHSSLSTTRRYVKATMAELEAAVETLYDVTKADTE
jgi:integrase/recombinase XerD